MRLFRRSLLCLVVGVTSFGVAGWAFRPRASWTVEFESTYAQFVYGLGDIVDDAPVWIRVGRGQRPNMGGMLIALDLHTGAKLKEVEVATLNGNERVTTDGQVRVVASEVENNQHGPREVLSTDIAIHDAKQAEPTVRQKLSGTWHALDDGVHAGSTKRSGRDMKVRVVDLRTGEEVWTAAVPGGRFGPISPDGTKAAAFTFSGPTTNVADGLVVWDLVNDRLLHRVEIPKRETSEEPVFYSFDARFIDGGRSLRAAWRMFQRQPVHDTIWYLDLQTGALANGNSKVAPEAPPNSQEIGVETSSYVLPFGEMAWFSGSNDPRSWLLGVERHGKLAIPWRRIPFELRVGQMGNSFQTWLVPPIHIQRSPHSVAAVVRLHQRPWVDEIPNAFRGWVPERFKSKDGESRTYFIEPQNERWRDVGCANAGDAQMRSDALLTLTGGAAAKRILQSWPLPPRDPKWPALGIATACMAGTWWMCAKRYRRRMKRATIPSVPA